MMSFRAEPISSQLAKQIRASRRDPFGGKAQVMLASDPRFPCRHCLEEAPIDSQVLLISYQPLARKTPYTARGPIFICAAECDAFKGVDTVPEIIASRTINLRAYDASGRMLYAHSQLSSGSEAREPIASMLSDDQVAEVHAHTALHGCFLCSFVRS